MTNHFPYVVAPRPSGGDEELWGLYLPAERRWIDIVFRSKHEADRLCDEMRRGSPE
ncbi:hypothetical protein [Sphingomonas sp. BK580]|uniref:hypothetical protein n=1 Tax=Sphingomonas sp. BK580 TaxID=2586972 RepID=UPI001620999B|nr:hypothetical protein [Sphingomonas sp. BK580]MBB3694691.1 hypothetical protein [Sphingomonas sp. BK580]